LKLGSKSRHFWYERYFTLGNDHTLRYYRDKAACDDVAAGSTTAQQPKASYKLSQLPDLHVSDLYVEKYQGEMVYCIKLTWCAENNTAGMTNNTGHDIEFAAASGNWADRPDHVLSAAVPASRRQASNGTPSSYLRRRRTVKRQSSSSVASSHASAGGGGGVTSPKASTKKKRGTPFSRLRKKGGSLRNGGSSRPQQIAPAQSIDRESLTAGSYPSPPRPRSGSGIFQQLQHGSHRQSSTETPGRPGEEEHIPELVEVDNSHREPPSTPTTIPTIPFEMSQSNDQHQSLLPTPPVSNHGVLRMANGGGSLGRPPRSSRALTEFERQREEDLQYLRDQFLSTQLANKKRKTRQFVQGTKIAAAAGAAIGLTVVTAGIGLVAGLVVLGVGAAAGGGGAVVQAAFKTKVTGELVIASTDYETACLWKTYLDVSKDSDSIKKSTWGQLFVSDGRKSNAALLPRMLVFQENGNNNSGSDRHIGHSMSGVGDVSNSLEIEQEKKWEPLDGGWASYLGVGAQGLRIFREVSGVSSARPPTTFSLDGPACDPMKAHVVIRTSPLDAFLCLMSYGRITTPLCRSDGDGLPLSPNSEQRASFRIIESIDDQTDIIHMVFRPLFLWPSWTAPRDYCLFRYWRLEQDGSYVVCYESMQHEDCPLTDGYVRGVLHQVITIAPQKRTFRRRGKRHGGNVTSSAGDGSSGASKLPQECLMTAVTQVDPKGWVPTAPIPFLGNQGYGDAFAVAALSLVLEIRDAIDHDRFIIPVAAENQNNSMRSRDVKSRLLGRKSTPSLLLNRAHSMDSAEEGREELLENADDVVNYDYAYASRELSSRMLLSGGSSTMLSTSLCGLAFNPPPFEAAKWAEPDSNSFRVRGRNYKVDRKKINAGSSIGKLVMADVVWSQVPMYSGFSAHPSERIQLALKKEEELRRKGQLNENNMLPPFFFVVTVMLPGPPFYYGVYYFAIDDICTVDGTDGTPSSKLCNDFFFAGSDEFRDNTFKMIPQITQGPFIVQKAVGNTPAIMGRQIAQHYVQDEYSISRGKRPRFFEVIMDCGSSSVAVGVIRLSLGYAKSLVVDMAYLLEGDDPSRLPERIFGAVRMKRIDFSPKLRKVEPPPPSSQSPSSSLSADGGDDDTGDEVNDDDLM